MRTALSAILLFCVLSPSAHAQSGPGDAWAGFHAAIVKADRTAAASALAADVQIFESGYVERSREEYLSHHFDADAKFAKSVTRKVQKHAEQVVGTMALIMEESETTGADEGQPIRLIGTESAVLRLTGDKWQIIHIHWSSRKPKQ